MDSTQIRYLRAIQQIWRLELKECVTIRLHYPAQIRSTIAKGKWESNAQLRTRLETTNRFSITDSTSFHVFYKTVFRTTTTRVIFSVSSRAERFHRRHRPSSGWCLEWRLERSVSVAFGCRLEPPRTVLPRISLDNWGESPENLLSVLEAFAEQCSWRCTTITYHHEHQYDHLNQHHWPADRVAWIWPKRNEFSLLRTTRF